MGHHHIRQLFSGLPAHIAAIASVVVDYHSNADDEAGRDLAAIGGPLGLTRDTGASVIAKRLGIGRASVYRALNDTSEARK